MQLMKLIVAGLVLAVAGAVALHEFGAAGLMAQVHHGLEVLRNAGPLAFFCGMALLPALGLPMMFFTLAAGPAFVPTLGMPAVIGLTCVAFAINMALTYWLARYALRTWLARLLARLGHKMPEVPPGDTTALIVLLRVTPGVPFFVQSCLLGLGDVPFRRYLLVSCLTACPHAAAWVYFGAQLKQGKAGLILLVVLVLIALAAGANLARRHYHGRRTKTKGEG